MCPAHEAAPALAFLAVSPKLLNSLKVVMIDPRNAGFSKICAWLWILPQSVVQLQDGHGGSAKLLGGCIPVS
jgi:hypothetical protein